MRSRLLIVVGVVAGLFLAGGVLFFLTQMQERRPVGATPPAQEETPEPSQPIVVAVQDIPACSEFVEGSVEVRDWPIANLPPNPITDLSELSGKIALVDIYRGEPILQDMIVARGEGGGAACFIPAGKVAVALPIDRQASVAYAIEKGDHVDVLVSYRLWDEEEQLNYIKSQTVSTCEECPPPPEPASEPIPRLVTQMTVQDAAVLKVGQWAFEVPTAPPAEGESPPPPPPPDIAIVIVDPQDAVVLKFARESGATIELALRSSENEGQQVSTEAVTLEYMVARFGISPPTRTPYRLLLPQAEQGVPVPVD